MRSYFLVIFFFFLFFSLHAFGQEKTSVAVHSDPRLAVLVKQNQKIAKQNHKDVSSSKSPFLYNNPAKDDKSSKNKTKSESESKYGFRVQIYSGPDRFKAMKIREEFDKHYPGVHSYLTYVSPTYRIKVGNYQHKNEAKGMFKEVSSSYFPCMIVPDKIQIK